LLKTEVEAASNGFCRVLDLSKRAQFSPTSGSIGFPRSGKDESAAAARQCTYNDAMSKMNQLKLATPDTIQLVASIYNQSVEQKPAQSGQTNPTTPAPQQQQNPFQTGTVFGLSQQILKMPSSPQST
jgi:hypothetical protein